MTQSRKVCRSMAQSLAASPRAYPSSTNASPNIRRAALASLLHAAACRKSVAVRSARIIVNAFGIEPSANHDQPAENHISACLRRPAESKVNAAGIILDLRFQALPDEITVCHFLASGSMLSRTRAKGVRRTPVASNALWLAPAQPVP